MDKNVIDFFENALMALYYNYQLDEALDYHCDFSIDDLTDYYSFEIEKELKIRVIAGAFKVVLIPLDPDFPYVLKIGIDEEEGQIWQENNIYEKACERGLSNFFAPVLYKTNIILQGKEINYLIAKKIPQDEWEYISRTSKTGRYVYWEEEVKVIFNSSYEESSIKKLLKFMNDFDITDIHAGNIGFLEEIPYLIDYA